MYVVRMALRNQLLDATVWKAIPLKDWTERDAHAIADVSLGAPNPESAAFLLKHLGQYRSRVVSLSKLSITSPAMALLKWSRHSPRSRAGNTPMDLGLQNDLFKAVRNGVQERGGKLDEADRQWAGELTDKLLASKQPGEVKSGAELVGALKLENREKRSSELALNKKAPRDQREAALAALSAINAGRNAAVLGRVLADASAPSNCARRRPSCWVREISRKRRRSC